ncbi:hypothetical protein ACFXB3_06340 [Streptomyces sp. NPDC059447]|uniref:hypothetical protein n=1 Tax=unclassified Streptomyces TaxID=2593676 RepID=UPI0036AE2EB8
MSQPHTPVLRHYLRSERRPTGETTVTCQCGLDTGAVPSDEARLAYEVHRNLIRDEIAARTDG